MTVLPTISSAYVLAFQFSSWYPKFASNSIKSTVIRPLSAEFVEYLNADGVIVPEGSGLEDTSVREYSSVEPDEDVDEDEEEEDAAKRYAFPELDQQIRKAIEEYGAVFPKLNFSSPKDASWILPPSAPLKCTSPADVYLLLKSSDFISHDLSCDSVFDGCAEPDSCRSLYNLELVLRKWYSFDRGRECRCFVRNDVLLGISQRDMNYYEFWNDPPTQGTIIGTVVRLWETVIKPKWSSGQHYTFDVLLTRDLSRAHIVDFNPYASRTDPLLFTYDELWEIHEAGDDEKLPVLRIIDSRAHPAANTNAPANQHNMVPFEALSIASGRDIDEFSQAWQEEVKSSLHDD
ncbi:D123-domain-containing protein [Hymenopellis radicata]|nr:D123-domain-containing protein [Hymenopellis radicata]